MTQKRILIVAFTNIAKDVRILRHIEALKSSFEIFTLGYGEKPLASDYHIEIPRLFRYLPLNPRGIKGLLTTSFHTAVLQTESLNFAKAEIVNLEFDLLFLNDVQTLPLIEIKNNHQKIVVDMHEFAPREMEDDWRFRVLLQKYYTWLCQTYLPKADLITTVSNGLRKGYESLCDVKVSIVRNICAEVIAEPQESRVPIMCVHSGLAVRGRKLERMIFSVSGLPNVSLDLYLVEAPRQKRYLKKLKKLAKRTNNVWVKDPVPQSQIVENLSRYDIGLLLIADSNFSLRHGLPNKLFDYVQARLMTICGPSPDMAEVVHEYDLGHVLQSYNALELREYLRNLQLEDIWKYKVSANNAASILNEESESRHMSELVASLF